MSSLRTLSQSSRVRLAAAWLALFALAAVIRVPRVVRVGSFEGGGDEWFTAWRSLQVLFERGNPGNFHHPALFYDLGALVDALVYCSGRAAGIYRDRVDLLAAFALHDATFLQQLQLVAAVAGALTVPVVFELSRRMFSPRAGLVAALVLALVPLHVEYSQRVRVDSLATLLVAVAGLALHTLDARGRRRDYMVAGACVGLATAANYPGALLILPLVLVHYRRARSPENAARATWLCLALASVFAAFVLANPYALIHPVAFARGFSFQFSMAYRTHPHADDRGAGFYLDTVLAQGIPFVLLAAGSIAWALVRARGLARVMAAFVLAYVIAFAVLRTQADRYVVPALPWLCVIIGGALDDFAGKNTGRMVAAGVALAAVCASLGVRTLPAAFAAPTREAREPGRAELQDMALSRVPRGDTFWLEADVLPFVQAAFADPGGALARDARSATARVYRGFDATVLKGGSVETLQNFDPALLTSGRVGVALTCDRNVREAERDEPGAQTRRAFYRTLRERAKRVERAPMGCAIYRLR